MTGPTVSVRLEGIVKRHGEFTRAARRRPSTIEPGEFFALLGPSGSGKTHDAAHPRRARSADVGPRAASTAGRDGARSPASATSPWCSRATRSIRT